MVDSDIRVHMLRTYVWLRRTMVIVTVLFLLALLWHRAFGSEANPGSISAYYYYAAPGCPLQTLFVGTLCCVAVLLIAYQGYTDGENILLNVAGYGLLGVVFFPMDPPAQGGPHSTRGMMHYASAFTFFACIAVVSLWYSRNTLDLVRNEPVRERYRRAYHLTGVLMLVLPGTATVLAFLAARQSVLFWLEVSGVVAFLAYWVVKSAELEMTGLETHDRLDELPKG